MIRKRYQLFLNYRRFVFQLQKITAIIRLNHQALDACLSQLINWTINASLTSVWNHVASQNAWSNDNRIN